MVHVKVAVALAGLAVGALTASVAAAGCSESPASQQLEGQKSQVVVSITRDTSGQLHVSVQAPPGTGVRVEAPPDVKVVAVGGDGAPGVPGVGGR